MRIALATYSFGSYYEVISGVAAASCFAVFLAGALSYDRIALGEDVEEVVQPLIVRAVAAKKNYDPLEPIIIKVEVENAPGFDVPIIEFVSPYQRINFLVINSQGKQPGKTQFGFFNTSHGDSHQKWSANQKVRMRSEIAVNLIRDMTMPGEYTVTASVPYGEYRVGNKHKMAHSAKSAPIKIIVNDDYPSKSYE